LRTFDWAVYFDNKGEIGTLYSNTTFEGLIGRLLEQRKMQKVKRVERRGRD
jgi:hypothetical protein